MKKSAHLIRRLLRRQSPRTRVGGALPPHVLDEDSQPAILSPGLAEVQANMSERYARRFWETLVQIDDARRTVLCPPDLVESVRATVERCQTDGRITVEGSRHCPEGRLLIIENPGIMPLVGEIKHS